MTTEQKLMGGAGNGARVPMERRSMNQPALSSRSVNDQVLRCKSAPVDTVTMTITVRRTIQMTTLSILHSTIFSPCSVPKKLMYCTYNIQHCLESAIPNWPPLFFSATLGRHVSLQLMSFLVLSFI